MAALGVLGGCAGAMDKRVALRPEANRVELMTGRPEGCQALGDVIGSASVEGDKEQATPGGAQRRSQQGSRARRDPRRATVDRQRAEGRHVAAAIRDHAVGRRVPLREIATGLAVTVAPPSMISAATW